MIEVAGDLFRVPGGYDAVCITTNGSIRKDGAAVMGRGVALQAKTRWPGVEFLLGHALRRCGNQVVVLTAPMRKLCAPGGLVICQLDWHLVTFPVKYGWSGKAVLPLIENSAAQLVMHANAYGWTRVALPRPGCGNGLLLWEDVAPRLRKHFDDRFEVWNLGG